MDSIGINPVSHFGIPMFALDGESGHVYLVEFRLALALSLALTTPRQPQNLPLIGMSELGVVICRGFRDMALQSGVLRQNLTSSYSFQ